MARINSKTEAFYTLDRTTGRKVYIGVVPSDGLRGPYLKTHADGEWKDNMLALPECGPDCRVIS
jgi:hypothetical protein